MTPLPTTPFNDHLGIFQDSLLGTRLADEETEKGSIPVEVKGGGDFPSLVSNQGGKGGGTSPTTFILAGVRNTSIPVGPPKLMMLVRS